MNVSQEAATNAVTVYAPVLENTCVGETTEDVFDAPLAGSPKFHNAVVMVAEVWIENDVPLFKQESKDLITPLQHKPTEIVRHTVVTGFPGSCNDTQTVYTPGPENVCVGYGDGLVPVIVMVSLVPLAGSPKFQKKYGELLVPSTCRSSVRLLHVSPAIFIPVICPNDEFAASIVLNNTIIRTKCMKFCIMRNWRFSIKRGKINDELPIKMTNPIIKALRHLLTGFVKFEWSHLRCL